jgi:hypothetical protein
MRSLGRNAGLAGSTNLTTLVWPGSAHHTKIHLLQSSGSRASQNALRCVGSLQLADCNSVAEHGALFSCQRTHLSHHFEFPLALLENYVGPHDQGGH